MAKRALKKAAPAIAKDIAAYADEAADRLFKEGTAVAPLVLTTHHARPGEIFETNLSSSDLGPPEGETQPLTIADGVALISTVHPKGKGVGRGHRIKKASLETVEIELPDNPPPPNADKKPNKKKKPKMKKPVSKKPGKAKKSGRVASVRAPRRPTAPSPTSTVKPAHKSKAVVLALVDAEIERKRALKTARQQRWRAKQKAGV